MSRAPFLIVATRPDGQRGLFTTEAVKAGAVLLTYDGPVIDHPTRLSIQVDEGVHIEGTEDSNAFVNHACDPSAYVDWDARCLRARRDLAADDELTCDYCTTDEVLAEPFTCRCGSPRCRGEIRGFAHLSPPEQAALARWLPPFLRKRL